MASSTLITGVSTGLGYGLAKTLLSKGGNKVYGMSRSRPDDLCAEGLLFESVDFADPENLRPVCGRMFEDVRSLDLVILNAGILNTIKDMADTPINEIEHVMRVNVWSHKLLLDLLFEAEIEVKQVIAVSSGAAVSGNRGWNAYSLSKAAFNMLTNLYAAERPETHFMAVAPGLIDTAMQSYISELPDDERYPTVDRLKSARGTEIMPSPEALAPRLLEVFEQIKERPSGSFVDIRKL